jgi:hypothetical protein
MALRYSPRTTGRNWLACCHDWLGDDIVTSLPELIDQEISPIKWDKYAVHGSI